MRPIHGVTCILLICPLVARAHVHWTRVNDVDVRCLGLYHFNDASADAGDTLAVASGLPADRGLVLGAPAGLGAQLSSNIAAAIFAPTSLRLRSAQIADSTAVLTGLTGDLTIECWFRWDPAVSYSEFHVGLRSGAKLLIARSLVNSASDRFGVLATHGDYQSAPGFTNWEDVGEEEAPLGEWLHAALTIRSTGLEYNGGLAHDVYKPGSTARFWLNGHHTGDIGAPLHIAGMRVHDDSRLRVRCTSGGIHLDEVTIWNVDWSNDATVSDPFGNGRGNGLPAPTPTPTPTTANVGSWLLLW